MDMDNTPFDPNSGAAVDWDNLDSSDRSGDPFEAIYALNIGDFVTDAFMSDDLLNKINNRLGDDPEKLRKQVEELIQIYSMDKTLRVLGYSSKDGFIIYDSIATSLCQMFEVDAVHLFHTARQEAGGAPFLHLTGTSLNADAKEGQRKVDTMDRLDIRLTVDGDDLLSQAYQSGELTVVEDVSQVKGWPPPTRLAQDQVKSVILAPLMEGSRQLGILLIESYSPKTFGPELCSLAMASAKLFVTAFRLQNLIESGEAALKDPSLGPDTLRQMRAEITESIADLSMDQQNFIEELSNAVDARNHFTRGHSKQVATVARDIAEALKLNEKSIDLIYFAGLVGNLGRIQIPNTILSKKESLSLEEWESLQEHPNAGVQLLMQIHVMADVAPFIHYKNERWDGSGNPEGLSGKSIPLGSRILAVADAYCAMTQARPYRESVLSHDEAMKQLEGEAGTKWDPLVVQTLARIPASACS